MASRAVFLRVILNSPGGDLQEALKITSLVKGARLSTRVVANGVCASACFFILLSDNRRDASGVEEDAQLKRQGSSSLYGLVGLHRPYIAPEVARTDPQSAMKKQKTVMSEVSSYLKDEGVSQRLIDIMMDRPSNNAYWLTDADVLQLGEYSPQMEEALIASCGYSRYRYLEKWPKERRDKLVDCITAFDVAQLLPDRFKYYSKLSTGWRPWKK
jgi:hypothetical protein